MAKIAMIIAPENFRDEELFTPLNILENKDHEVIIASKHKGICKGSRGGAAIASMHLNEINAEDFDAVVFVGGPGSKVYFNEKEAFDVAEDFNNKNKLIAAICIAPVILANAGLLKGKKATVFNSETESIKKKGAIYTGEPVTVHGNIITADGPAHAELFAQKINDTLLKMENIEA